MDYGDVIYRNAAPTTLLPLDTVYHSALRFITGESYSTHHCSLSETVGWPFLAKRRTRNWYQCIFKAIDGKLPPHITLLLDWQNVTYRTRSGDRLNFEVPSVQSELHVGKSAFCFDLTTLVYFWFLYLLIVDFSVYVISSALQMRVNLNALFENK